MTTVDPVLTAILALLPNVSVAAVFVFAWFMERRERQNNLATLLVINADNQKQLAVIVARQFELMSRLHIEPVLPPAVERTDLIVPINSNQIPS